MTPQFIQYPKCGTCQKAEKWLKTNNIDIEARNIIEQNPTADELRSWIAASGIPVSKFFNTSGLRYKALGLKDIVKSATESELIALLASDGMLVKRPILVTESSILVGFKEPEWDETLLGQ